MRPVPREGYTVFDRLEEQTTYITQLERENSFLREQLAKANNDLKQRDAALTLFDERLKQLQKLANEQKAEPAKNSTGIDLGRLFNIPKSQPQKPSTPSENITVSKGTNTETPSEKITVSKETNTDEEDVIFAQNFPF